MSPPLSYPEMIRQVKKPYDLRLRLLFSARQIGVKPTARLLGASPQTVRLWVRRFVAEGRKSLASRSHAPKSCPHRTPARLEARVVRLRKQTGFGAKRLKVEFELPVSEGAIARILRQRALVRPRTPSRVYGLSKPNECPFPSSAMTPKISTISPIIGPRPKP